MKTLNNFRIDNNFEEITIGQVTICAPSSAVYKLTLPIDTGINGQVLTTDGNGTTSWISSTTGTLTSVALDVPDFLTIADSPLTGAGGLMTIGLNSGTALPVNSGGTGVITKTGDTSVVLSNAPTINSLNLTGDTDVSGDIYLDDTALYLRAATDQFHGLKLSMTGDNNGPDLFGHTRGQLSIQGVRTLSWDNQGVDVIEALSAKSLTLTNALPVSSGGTGVTIKTGTDNLVLSNSPFIISPTLTTAIIKGVFSNTILDTQSTALWTLSLPIDGGAVGQVLTTNGSGLTSWTTSTVGSVTSVAASVPSFLSISGSPITTSGTLAIGLSGTALPTLNGGTGSTFNSTGAGGVCLNNTPEIKTPKIVGATFKTTLDTEATADYVFKLPVDGGTSNQIFRSDGDGTNSWMGLAVSMGILGGSLSVAAATLSEISDNTLDIGTNATDISDNKDDQDAVNGLQVVANAGFSSTSTLMAFLLPAIPIPVQPALTAQVITNAGFSGSIGTNTGNISTNSASLLTKLSTVGISAPAFLTTGSAVTTIDGTGGTLDLLLSGTALPVTSGGTGVLTSTGIGDTVLSNGPSIDAAFLKDCAIEGSVFDTILTTAATSDWTLTLPVDGGTSNQVLTTSGGGVTSWTTSTVGSVTSVAASVPSFLSISGSPITTSGTLAIGLSGIALPVLSGGTGVTASTGTTKVVLSDSPTIDDLTTNGATFTGDTRLDDVPLYLRTSDNDHGIRYSNAGGNDGPDIFGSTRGQVSIGTPTPLKIMSWDANSVYLDQRIVMNDNSIFLRGGADVNHGLVYDGVINGPNLHGFNGGALSSGNGTGTVRMSWTSAGINVPGVVDAGSMTLSSPLPTASGGTGTTSVTGSGSLVLANSPTISNLIMSNTSTFTGDLNMNQNEIFLKTVGDVNHGLVFDGGINGPNLHGFGGGTLSKGTGGGVPIMTWNGDGTYTRGPGGSTFIAQFQSDYISSEDSSIAITAGENDKASIFFGTNNGNAAAGKTGAHKVAIISEGIDSFSRADLHFCLNNVGNNSTSASIADSRMMIEPDGNVGIGTTAPASKLDVNGTITANDLVLDNALPVSQGGTGTTSSTGSGSVVLATSPSISGTTLTGVTGVTGNMFMNDNSIYLRNDANHGIEFEGSVDGPNVFGNAKGVLSTSGTGRVWWNNNGLSTDNSNFFKYSQFSFTPTWGGDGNVSYGDRSAYIVRMGRNVTVTIQIVVTVTVATPGRVVFFTGMGLNNPLGFWQRVPLADGTVTLPILNTGPYWFVIKNGASFLDLFHASGPVLVDVAGLFSGSFYTTFSYVGPDT